MPSWPCMHDARGQPRVEPEPARRSSVTNPMPYSTPSDVRASQTPTLTSDAVAFPSPTRRSRECLPTHPSPPTRCPPPIRQPATPRSARPPCVSYSARAQPVRSPRLSALGDAGSRSTPPSTTLVRRQLLKLSQHLGAFAGVCASRRDDGAFGVDALLLFPRRGRTGFARQVAGVRRRRTFCQCQYSVCVRRRSSSLLGACPIDVVLRVRLRGRRRRRRLANPDCAEPKLLVTGLCGTERRCPTSTSTCSNSATCARKSRYRLGLAAVTRCANSSFWRVGTVRSVLPRHAQPPLFSSQYGAPLSESEMKP